MKQSRKFDSQFSVGSDKLEEIVELVKEHKVKKLIFDNKLKSVQAYNIAKKTGVEAIDRFQLILEVFAHRASTTEAKLQIKLARLRYELTYAKDKVRLERLGEQPGFMGLGTYEVDIYYEVVRRQINSIREKLKKIKKTRSLHRKRRKELGFLSIALAGYTYAGKSTLFNLLVEAAVPTGEGLFTTLSTTTRLIELSGKRVLLTDTVGFIERLSVDLVDAFRSTLEETTFADLILLIVDASESLQTIEKKLSVCLDTIEKIGAYEIPLVIALNKIDLLSELEVRQRMEAMRSIASDVVSISALENINIDTLKQQLSKLLKSQIQATITLPINDETLSFVSWIFSHAHVKKVKYEEDRVKLTFEAVSDFIGTILGRVENYGGVLTEPVTST